MSYRREYDVDLLRVARTKLRRAFVSLRRLGLKARANYLCCQGCGNAALSETFDKKDVGGVFWHHQDDAGFREDGDVYLAFFLNNGPKDVDPSAELVGHMIVDALTEQGLDVEWNGDSDERIHVYAEGARKEEANA